MIYNWENEIRNTPQTDLPDPPRTRAYATAAELLDHDVTITTYGTLRYQAATKCGL